MSAHSTINIHLTDDTLIRVREYSDFVIISLAPDCFVYVGSENQLAELAQAVDIAAKFFS